MTSPGVASLLARGRFELGRRRWLARGLVAASVGAAAWAALALVAGVHAERERWGESVAVVVAVDDIEPGTRLHDRVVWREHPVAVVPPSAIGHVDPSTTARRHVVAGSVVTDADVVSSSGPRALLTADELAVVVTERVASGARVGDDVVVATEGHVLADRARVVGVHDDRTVVAVDAAVAPMVAAAALGPGGVSLLLSP